MEWMHIDRKLRLIACKRSALDAAEAKLLRDADRVAIWREFACVSILDYMERVLGYGPKAAQDRIRVAEALEELPWLTEALAHDELKFTAIRELTRIATPGTDLAWRDWARDRTLRDIERKVTAHKKGDHPSDPEQPDLRMKTIKLDLTPSMYAAYLRSQEQLCRDQGRPPTDSELMATWTTAHLEARADARADERGDAAAPTRANNQISITQCEQCRQGWEYAAGKRIAIEKSAMERAECDAQWIGSLEAQHPERAVQDVTPAMRRFVWARDEGRCRVPGFM